MRKIRMNMCYAIFLLVILSLQAAAEQEKISLPEGRWIDLTHDFSSETIYWPTAEGFSLITDFAGETDRGYYYEAHSYKAAEHGGTHIDSPIHFAEGKQTLDELPLDRLTGEAVVLDVSKKALKNPDYLVSVRDFTDWESAHGRIPEGAIVLLNTGYAQFWPDRVRYMGTDERGLDAVANLHFPGLDPEAAKWLVENRKIASIGLDTPSIDYGQSKLFMSHRILFAENIPAFENVANLDKLPPVGAVVIALPMKIKGGSGGPLRIVAIVPE